MLGYKLSDEQYNEVQGQKFAPFECFNCVQDINGIWFTFFSDQQKQEISSTEWSWILDLPQAEYTPPPTLDFI